jgi:hypothetical protein
MPHKYTKEECLELLRAKAAEPVCQTRLPQRDDFANEEVVAIKAFLGPWPRALESAGLKAPRSTDRLEQNREKRIRAKRRHTEQLKADKQNEKSVDIKPLSDPDEIKKP